MNSSKLSKKPRFNKHLLSPTRHHPFVVPLVTFIGLAFVAMLSFIIFGGGSTVGPSDVRVVNVYVDEQKQTLPTRAKTVKDLLQRINVSIKTGDIVEPSLDSVILTDGFNINVYRARPVTIVDEGKKVTINSANQSPRVAARDAGVVVYPEDEIIPEAPENILAEGVIGERYIIDRASPITLVLYGNISGIRTQAETVGDLLKEKKIKIGEKDLLVPSPDTPIRKDMTITLTREGQKITTVEEEIPIPIEYIDDPNLMRGKTIEKEPGAVGKKVVTYEIKLENDIEVSRLKLQEITTIEPVKKVIARGSKIVISNPSENVRIGEQLAAGRGWTGEQWYCLYQLWQKESGWNTTSGNPSTGAYGIPQALPGSKMSSAGSDWASNPTTQINWGMGYISGRYGSPCSAWSTSQARGWY